MGGYGSGRRYWHTKKTTVEECRWIDVSRWSREGIIAPRVYQMGSWRWSDAHTGEERASIGYEVDTTGTVPWVRLFYTITRGRDKREEVDYKVCLQTTKPYFGGVRWWFTCPLTSGGRYCGRRVSKLYLPPGGTYFGCRHCYDLTYTSCQESHKFDRVYALLAAGMMDEYPGITGRDVERLLKR